MRTLIAIAALTACCGSWATDNFNYYDAGQCSAFYNQIADGDSRRDAIQSEAKELALRASTKEEVWQSAIAYEAGFSGASHWMAELEWERRHERAIPAIVENNCHRFAAH